MFRNNFTTWPLKARVLWIIALAIETISATSGLVRGTRHIINALLSFTMAILMFVALGCQIFAMDIRARKKATDHENASQSKQE